MKLFHFHVKQKLQYILQAVYIGIGYYSAHQSIVIQLFRVELHRTRLACRMRPAVVLWGPQANPKKLIQNKSKGYISEYSIGTIGMCCACVKSTNLVPQCIAILGIKRFSMQRPAFSSRSARLTPDSNMSVNS